VYVEAGLTKKS